MKLIIASALILGSVLPATAGDLPKEGTFSGIYNTLGQYKAYPVGNDRVLFSLGDQGELVSDGFLDHSTWQCWGKGDHTKGTGHDQGTCVATDPSGDKVVDEWISEDYTIGQKKPFKINSKFSGGSGKYTGITGDFTGSVDGGFSVPEGSYIVRTEMKGSYKLTPTNQQ
jgi:hypothetical protein